jgi:hypothetical protein
MGGQISTRILFFKGQISESFQFLLVVLQECN